MTELGHYRKQDLITLAEGLGVEISSGDATMKIIRKIEGSENYDKETAIGRLKGIQEDRETKIEYAKREREKVAERKHQLDKLKIMKGYLIGNRTQMLTDSELKKSTLINAVGFGSQERIPEREPDRLLAREKVERGENEKKDKLIADLRADEEPEIELPKVELDGMTELINVNSKPTEFKGERNLEKKKQNEPLKDTLKRGKENNGIGLCNASPSITLKIESIVEALLITIGQSIYPLELKDVLETNYPSVLTTGIFRQFKIEKRVRDLQQSCYEESERGEGNLYCTFPGFEVISQKSKYDSPTSRGKGTPLVPKSLLLIKRTRGIAREKPKLGSDHWKLTESLLFGKWGRQRDEPILFSEYMFDLLNRLKRCQELAAEIVGKKSGKRKFWYDKGTRRREFKPGEQVLVLATPKQNKCFLGVIEGKISETNYTVNLPGKREQSKVYHINLLKPYYQRIGQINLLMEEMNGKIEGADLEISYPAANPDIYNVEEIMNDNESNNLYTEISRGKPFCTLGRDSAEIFRVITELIYVSAGEERERKWNYTYSIRVKMRPKAESD